jgi:hypothetical protein
MPASQFRIQRQKTIHTLRRHLQLHAAADILKEIKVSGGTTFNQCCLDVF